MTDLRARMTEMYGMMGRQDLDAFDALVAPDFVEHATTPNGRNDWEGVKEFFTEMLQAIPDFSMTPEDMVVDGDKVWARGRMRGTQKGEFMGMPATDKSFDIEFFDLIRFEGDKVAEHWGQTDQTAMMQQLGMMPENAPA